MGVVVAIRVGHNLQEDVHLVEDGGESRVTAIISHDLHVKGHSFQCSRSVVRSCRDSEGKQQQAKSNPRVI